MNSLEAPISGFDVTRAMTDRLTGESKQAGIQKASKEFESVFISMMLKTMRQSMSKDMFAGDESDTFGGLFDSFMGQHIAEKGGIGLGQFFESLGQLDNSPSPAGEGQPSSTDHQKFVEAYRHASTS